MCRTNEILMKLLGTIYDHTAGCNFSCALTRYRTLLDYLVFFCVCVYEIYQSGYHTTRVDQQHIYCSIHRDEK